MKIPLFTLILIICLQYVSAQERLSGLVVNPQVKEAGNEAYSARELLPRLTLPFSDDFSNNGGIFPNKAHWTDNYVFINNDYPVNPPTIGVATFDAIDNQGKLYHHASSFQFSADTLTSVEVRLDSLFSPNARKITVSDSVYFSFFYQPQGVGNAPAAHDSLLLEFLAPDEDIVTIIPADTVLTGEDTVYIAADTIINQNWVEVWSSAGDILENFHNINGSWFKQVLIPIKDSSRFYKPDFRFRFRNYASLADIILPDWQSNGDIWNIDYIFLDVDRSRSDTAYPDVAFAGKAPNMLRRYTSMPYDQFRKQFVTEMADSISMKITNLNNESFNAAYRYEVTDNRGNLIHVYDGGTYFIPSYATNGYVNYPDFSHPPVDFLYPINNPEPVVFTTTHILTTNETPERRTNDTVVFNQRFSNYLSYDDGTAEAGYGVAYLGAEVAYKFQLNKNDSLFGVNMFFNQTLNQGNVQDFYLNVWNDYFGQPGELIYSRFGYQPVLTDSLNKFFYYELDSALFIEPGNFPNLVFYVGWQQSTDDNLNVGFDRNDIATDKIFFKTFGNWSNSLMAGALMIRPIIGKEKILALEEKADNNYFSLYPNPATGALVRIKTSISNAEFRNYSLRISTSDGRVVSDTSFGTDLNVSGLSNGLYFVQLINDARVISAEKLIINH